jgi:hypothetical protein
MTNTTITQPDETSERARLEAELADAEGAVQASLAAIRWRPFQSTNWNFLTADSRRVADLKQRLCRTG